MGKYVAKVTRRQIRAYGNAVLANSHVAEYKEWRGTAGSQWLAEEKEYYEKRRLVEHAQEQQRLTAEAEKQLEVAKQDAAKKEAERWARLTPTERHKELLERFGREYRGVRKPAHKVRRNRTPHCYSCFQNLDNSIDIECAVCGWIICACGACGCGYSYRGK